MPLEWMDMQPAAGDAEPPGEAEIGDLLEGLNEAQHEAAVHGDGPLLILAGAGSGKTRVITRRIAWLVLTGRARPEEVLAITFTNKAAREMRERVGALLPAQGMWISTFHAMCARILRREIEVLTPWTRDFTIYDTHDKNQLLKSITKDLGYDTQRFRPAMLSGWISDWKTGRFDEGALGHGDYGHGGSGMEEEVLNKVRDRYEKALAENNALDFDDLLVKVLEIFDAHPGVRDVYARRFRYVLVDEYQDTNRIQYLLTRHLSGHHRNLAVCGDPDQSIYAWRGADIRNILDFEEDFGAGNEVRVVKLERNYRSADTILRAAQSLIRHNRGRKEKDLWTDKESTVPVRVVECGDENDEANEIASRIHGLRARGVGADDIAIFYRVNFMQRALERAMRLAGVPYQIVGGVEFYQRREVRDLLSYLHLVANPRDDVACRRVMNVPARGIGEKSLGIVSQWAAERTLPLLAAVLDDASRAEVRGRAKKGLEAFAGLMSHLGDFRERSASEALEAVLDETDYVGWLSTSGDPDTQARVENVEELRASAESYDKDHPEGGLLGFLQDVALVSDVDAWEEDSPKVTLMTLHASKGLEFPIVFIAGFEEELLPHGMALQEEGDEGVEEERRLAYVGLTRAMDELTLTWARTRLHYGESSWRLPSRFLEELPADEIEGGPAGSDSAVEEEPEDFGAYDAPENSVKLEVGARVEHDHFGYGYVERLQGSGINARVTVDFRGVGSKVLLVQYANLKVVAT